MPPDQGTVAVYIDGVLIDTFGPEKYDLIAIPETSLIEQVEEIIYNDYYSDMRPSNFDNYTWTMTATRTSNASFDMHMVKEKARKTVFYICVLGVVHFIIYNLLF